MMKMSKDVFMMLVMGLTSEAAMAFKNAYIAAFNALAAYVATHRKSPQQIMLSHRPAVCRAWLRPA
jgi:phage regulator Rha-like protein